MSLVIKEYVCKRNSGAYYVYFFNSWSCIVLHYMLFSFYPCPLNTLVFENKAE